MIDDARNTRIQHDKFLPETGGRKGGVPPGYTRACGEIISKEKEVSEYHMNSSVCVVLRGSLCIIDRPETDDRQTTEKIAKTSGGTCR